MLQLTVMWYLEQGAGTTKQKDSSQKLIKFKYYDFHNKVLTLVLQL